MNATNRLAPGGARQPFSNAITSNAMQGLIQKSLKDDKVAARFTSTLISAVNASDQLKECDPGTIVAAALRGEGMGLTLGMGYYLVPYGKTCTYILGYKGMLQLALSTGAYNDIDCIDIREGEYKGRDRRTGKPSFDFNVYESDEDREAAKITGYYAYFELKDGLFRSEYWSMDKLLRHAERYAQAFDLEKYKAFVAGELSEAEEAKIRKSTPWYDVDGGQERMCKKTVLRSLLNSGYAPLSNEVRYALDNDAETGVIPDVPVLDVDKRTGEVVSTTPATPALDAAAADEDFFGGGDTPEQVTSQREIAKQEAASAQKQPRAQKTQRETARPDAVQIVPTEDDGGFFGGGDA